MDTDSKPTEDPKNPLVACTVLVAKTTYFDVILGKGAKIRIPKKDAETLADLTPPAVQITGI